MFGERIRDARGAIARFLLELLSTDDVFFLMAFNHAPHVLTPWTSDPEIVRTALDSLRPSGGTAIYDAVQGALPLIDSRPRDRAALVVISDGADTASDVTLRDLRASLLRTDAFIYAIAIDSQARQAINTRVNPEALAEITNQSGGRTEVVHDTTDLGPATARIAEELNNQYVLGYSSPRPGDGKYHAHPGDCQWPGIQSARAKRLRRGPPQLTRNHRVAAPVTRQDAAERCRVDIAARHHDRDRAAAQPTAILDHGRERCGAGSFDHVVRVVEQRPHRLLDFIVGDFDDALGTGPNQRQRLWHRRAARHPVCDPRSRIVGNRVPELQRSRVRRGG